MRVDICCEKRGWTSEIEADEGKDHVEANINEDVENDVFLRQLVERTSAECS